MSKSRLEKFLYALYSLDSSDLPTPLSRIEELYKCLVTGDEAPTFEPLSRVEKYLMSILGGYDVELLPNPLSRAEVLLHKLATGDDNLDDIDSFLSEHEELLAEIIRNGGVGGNIDIEYVLYTLSTEFNTLYNTAKKPVKSAILSGMTLVNLINEKTISQPIINKYSLKYVDVNKKYFIKFKCNYAISQIGFSSTTTNWNTSIAPKVAEGYVILTPNTNLDITGITIRTDANTTTEIPVFNIICHEYQDGMENWDIPYFEGMQSVKMPVLTATGKNLFDVSNLPRENAVITPTLTGYILTEYSCGFNKLVSDVFPNLIEGKTYVVSFQVSNLSTESANNSIGFYNAKTQKLSYYRNNESFTLTNEMYYERVVILYGVRGELVEFSNVQIEEGTTVTSYEPFKSNILTVNEEVELRGIGKVQDTLDCLTGEVTHRVDEIVLDGSEEWKQDAKNDTYTSFLLPNTGVKLQTFSICNKLPVKKYPIYNLNSEGVIGAGTNGHMLVFIKKDRLLEESVSGFKSWLSSNPLIVHYELAEPVIKTVDLSVVDQDGNNTKLSTFNDITHVTLSSEALIPEAEMEVAEKVPEVAASMLIISREQEVIDTATNEQSENVDATMIAATEIYEGLL